MTHAAVLHAVVDLAAQDEYGYDSARAEATLRAIDPAYDWTPELLQYELEAGYRTMGPHLVRPGAGLTTADLDAALRDLYHEPMRNFVDARNPFFAWFR